MKLVFLAALTIFISTKSYADFVKTNHDFGNFVKVNDDLIAIFEFKNPGPYPAILTQTSRDNSINRCVVSNYTKEPIKKNFVGKVIIKCKFTDIGFNQKQVATFNVVKAGGTSNQTLSVKAMVVDSSECKPLDINNEAPLKSMPVLDQDGMGICYAFTTAQLLEFQIKKSGINKTISPIDVSFKFKEDLSEAKFNLDMGSPYLAVLKILKEGAASRTCIDRVIKKHTQGTTLTSEEFLKIVGEVWTNRRKNVSNVDIKKKLKPICDSFGLSSNQFDIILGELKVPFNEYLTDIFSECDKERDITDDFNKIGLVPKKKSLGGNPEFTKFMDNLLDKKNPVIISMCGEILVGKPKHRGLVIENGERKTATSKGVNQCSGHAVLVTGRRKVNNSCEYLVRNSWGANWVSKDMSCACKTRTAYYPDCKLNKEKSGDKVMVGCWVKEENLIPNTINVIGF